jgi:hypothetical protein
MISTLHRNLFALLFLTSLTGAASAQPFVLVTEQEAAASRAAGGMMTPRVTSQAGGPRIEVLVPDVSKPVSAPTGIEVRFVATAPAEPRPESFRVLYGAFKIDVTQRLLGVTKVTKDGITVSDAVLPAGTHQLFLLIADTFGRESTRVVSLSVKQ